MIEVLQVTSEFMPVLGLYRSRSPARVLEIGTWQGGTLREWLAGGPALVVAVDLDHQRPELYEDWRKPETELEVVTGDSQDPAIKALIRRLGPYDWLFVDGDHAEQAVRSDVALAIECAAPGAVLLLHDVSKGARNVGEPGPRIVLEELRGEGYEIEEFVEHPYEGPWAHGVGVVHL